MKYRHYAPNSPVFLIDGDEAKFVSYVSSKSINKSIAVICYDCTVNKIQSVAPKAFIYSFGDRNDEIKQAHLLFDILRDADKRNFDEIYAPLPTQNGVGLALYNRMIRAAAYQIIRL